MENKKKQALAQGKVTKSMIRKIRDIAEEAGELLLETAGGDFSISRKQNRELVTTADLLSEKLLKNRLLELTPKAGFSGEESWKGKFPSPPFWIVDPLDGTNNYAHGYPVWSVSIAYWNGEKMEYGCVHDPGRKETFYASAGGGAFMNGARIRTSEFLELEDCIAATGFPYHRRKNNLGVDLNVLEFFLERVQGIRRGGSAALDLAYVACGRLDGYWEEHLKPWDMAAGMLLVLEAGGKVSAYEGGKWKPSSRGIVASGEYIHSKMVHGINEGA